VLLRQLHRHDAHALSRIELLEHSLARQVVGDEVMRAEIGKD
jgi:hypothetical protein